MSAKHCDPVTEIGMNQLCHAQTAPLAGRLARSLLSLLLVLLILLALTPWQQNVRGLGRVVAYPPAERQQSVGAPVDGRISRWLVREGSRVKQGCAVCSLARSPRMARSYLI